MFHINEFVARCAYRKSVLLVHVTICAPDNIDSGEATALYTHCPTSGCSKTICASSFTPEIVERPKGPSENPPVDVANATRRWMARLGNVK